MRNQINNIMLSPPIINISNLDKTYNLNNNPVHALKNISFSIHPGQIIFVMGPSGSGKTTLLNLIGGIDSPTEGEIDVSGEKISRYSPLVATRNFSFLEIFNLFFKYLLK